MANLNFDASQIETNSYSPLPDGWYAVAITEADMAPTKDGTTEYLKLTFEVTGPEFSGRKVWERLNINHANQQPREIAQRNLATICKSIGLLQVRDTDQLLGASLMIKVRAVPADDRYDARNEVRGYKPLNNAPAPAKAAPAAATTAKKAPWQK